MKNIESLFWDIFNSENEQELNDLIINDDLLSDNNNWIPYGKDGRNNFGTFESQQNESVPALVEKLTNSIDSLLLKQCRLNKIDPKSSKAPKNMADAVEKFYNIKNGDFSEVSSTDRRNIAADIQVLATEDKNSPNLLVYDNGEGQHPDNFPDTFLSLFKGNKTIIPFVHGKYNMGSTGAVAYCGRKHCYQLIGSKLQDKLNNHPSNPFGFTLVRRHPLTIEEENQYIPAWYEYFVINGEVPRFEINTLDFGLWGRKFNNGSIVKLFSYQLPRGSRSDITLDLWRDLNHFLYHPALPLLVYEKRFKGGHSPTKLMLGNKTRLVIDERDKKEKTKTISIEDKEMGIVPIEYTVFHPEVKQSEFIKNKAVVFTLNGQVQGRLERRFISQDLGYSMLRDSLLIQIECTYLKPSFRRQLFMASRDRLKEDSEETQILKNKIISLLKSDDTLKELNQNRKRHIFHENIQDKELIKQVMSNLPIDKDLLKLLKKGGDLNFIERSGTTKNGTKKLKEKIRKKYTSKRFPSIFKIDSNGSEEGKKVKSIPLNGKGVIKFETDVEDEYLFRPKEKGELQLQILGYRNIRTGKKRKIVRPSKVEDILNVTKEGPIDNTIKITFEPQENINVGDEIKISACLTSPSGDLKSIFWVRIVNPKKETKKIKTEKDKDLPAIPKPIKVFEKAESSEDKTWNDFGWSGVDIVKVITNTGVSENSILVEAIAVNMDSFALRRYISRQGVKTMKQIKLVKDKYFMSVYFHTLFLYSIFEKLNKSNDSNSKFDPEDLIPLIFKPYSAFLLASNTDDAILSSLTEE